MSNTINYLDNGGFNCQYTLEEINQILIDLQMKFDEDLDKVRKEMEVSDPT